MKISKQIIVACLSIFCVVLTSCDSKYNNNANYEGNDYTISTQAEVNAFAETSDIRTLTISGENVTDLSKLPFKSIKNLIITNTGIQELNLPNLTSVTVSVTIDNNPLLTAINGISSLTFVNGVFTITNNELLTDISSLKTIKRYKGAIFVTNNPSLGKDVDDPADYTYGLFPLLYLSQSGSFDGAITLLNNHPESANEVAEIGQISAGVIRSYTLTNATDIEKFIPKSDIVNNLTVKGAAITTEMLKSIATKIKEVQGTMLLENTSVATTIGFFDVVKCTGSIVLRDNTALIDAEGFIPYKKIGGDFIVENSPGMGFWVKPNSIGNVTEITGSAIFRNTKLTNQSFTSLESVGGDFEISNCTGLWNVSDGFPKIIGGDLTLSSNSHLNTLAGINKLTSLGGNLTIVNNGTNGGGIGEIVTDSGPHPGWCLIERFIRTGAVKPEAVITLKTLDGTAIDPFTLPTCTQPQ